MLTCNATIAHQVQILRRKPIFILNELIVEGPIFRQEVLRLSIVVTSLPLRSSIVIIISRLHLINEERSLLLDREVGMPDFISWEQLVEVLVHAAHMPVVVAAAQVIDSAVSSRYGVTVASDGRLTERETEAAFFVLRPLNASAKVRLGLDASHDILAVMLFYLLYDVENALHSLSVSLAKVHWRALGPRRHPRLLPNGNAYVFLPGQSSYALPILIDFLQKCVGLWLLIDFAITALFYHIF